MLQRGGGRFCVFLLWLHPAQFQVFIICGGVKTGSLQLHSTSSVYLFMLCNFVATNLSWTHYHVYLTAVSVEYANSSQETD